MLKISKILNQVQYFFVMNRRCFSLYGNTLKNIHLDRKGSNLTALRIHSHIESFFLVETKFLKNSFFPIKKKVLYMFLSFKKKSFFADLVYPNPGGSDFEEILYLPKLGYTHIYYWEEMRCLSKHLSLQTSIWE